MRTSAVIFAVAAGIVLSSPAVSAQDGPRPDTPWLASSAPAVEPDQAGGDTGERPDINSAIAGGMSAFLPGAGQFYNGQGVKGGLMIAGFAASVAFAWTQGISELQPCTFRDGRLDDCGGADQLLNNKFWVGMGAATGIYAWSVFDAISVARRRTAETPDSERGASMEVGPMLRGGEPALGASLRLRR